MIDPRETGKRLNEHRQARGMSQQEVAALMNVTHQAVSKWETGASLPDMQTLLALSRLYHTTMEELLIGAAPEGAPQTAPPREPAEDVVPDTLPTLSFPEIMSMVPFLEEKTVDALVERLGDALTREQLTSLAPFLSERCLASLFHSARGQWSHGELMALMPFLPGGMLDNLVLSGGFTNQTLEAQPPTPPAESRAQRALRERDDAWIDEHAEAFSAEELYALCAYAREHRLEEGLHLLLEHARRGAVGELIALASKAEDWALVALAAECMT